MEQNFFDRLNLVQNTIFNSIASNQTLLRLLYYTDSDPLSSSLPDVTFDKVMMNNLFPLYRSPDIEVNKKTIINFVFDNVVTDRTNYYKDGLIVFDIMSHIDLWLIDEGNRLLIITAELDRLFDNKFINGLSLNNLNESKWKSQSYSDNYKGYRLTYRITEVGSVNCME